MTRIETYLSVTCTTLKFGRKEVGGVVLLLFLLLEDIIRNSEKFDIEDIEACLFVNFAICASLEAFFFEVYVASRETPGTWEY